MGIADHNILAMSAASEGQITWSAVGDEHELGWEAALPYLLDHTPATFAEPAPAVVSPPRHAA